MEGDKYTQVREDMSPSRPSISKSSRLRRKLIFQNKGEEKSRIAEIGRFLIVTTLKGLGPLLVTMMLKF